MTATIQWNNQFT